MSRLISIIGLGFGDCGKGRFTDHFCGVLGATAVVRYNGGAQAGHTVVLPDGRHHVFSQFGAGTFWGTRTILASPFVVHPTALLVEAQVLARAGVPNALNQLGVDPKCLVTTPYHQAAGRLRELARGNSAHGTCGVGFGETVGQSLVNSGEALTFGALGNPSQAMTCLQALRARLGAELAETRGLPGSALEWQIFDDPGVLTKWLDAVRALTAQLGPQRENPLGEALKRPDPLVFEGAQGVLLDEGVGFHPHTTWSSPLPDALDRLVQDAGCGENIQHFGVLRAYLTRHGAGPMPTEDRALDALSEAHNEDGGWQGRFRRGHPDGVLLDYALEASGRRFDGLLLSHMDALGRREGKGLHWCEGYDAPEPEWEEPICTRDVDGQVIRLRPGRKGDLRHQERLTTMLKLAKPRYAPDTLDREGLIQRVEETAKCRVAWTSHGTGNGDVIRRW